MKRIIQHVLLSTEKDHDRLDEVVHGMAGAKKCKVLDSTHLPGANFRPHRIAFYVMIEPDSLYDLTACIPGLYVENLA